MLMRADDYVTANPGGTEGEDDCEGLDPVEDEALRNLLECGDVDPTDPTDPETDPTDPESPDYVPVCS
ncbi:hypothetical protein GW750_08550 [bacterium]|nr:hypothetical protein [bacterium]